MLNKGLPTLIARVRLLLRVDPLVVHQGGTVAEGLPALTALIGLLPRVHIVVLDED